MTQRPAPWFGLLPALGAWLIVSGVARAQDAEPLGIATPALSGVHSLLTDSWATLELTVVNRGTEARDTRVVVFYASQPDVQYARDVWVPGRSSRSTSMLLGPPPAKAIPAIAREVEFLLYDRTGGQERLVLPAGEERVRSRSFLYHPRDLIPITSTLFDYSEPTLDTVSKLSQEGEDAVRLLHTFRYAAGMRSLHIEMIQERFLPATLAGFDGIDCLVLAGRRIADDPAGTRTLRSWLEQGGMVWVMLDMTEPEVVARLLGDSLPFQVVDRTSVVRPQIISVALSHKDQSRPLELDQPVDLVRVLVGPEDQVLQTINGWPAAFVRPFGRGLILFTTVGARAWMRERTPQDLKLPLGFDELPVALSSLEELCRTFGVRPEPLSIFTEALKPLAVGEVGYSVPERNLAALIFGVFLLVVLGLGLVLQRQQLTIAGLAGPAAALAAAAVFLFIGSATRHAVPPTVAAAEIVHVAPAASEQVAAGLLAQYRPDEGALPVKSTEGGALDLDTTGIQGQTRRRVITDTRSWHWEDLALPAGMRLGPYEYVVRTEEPMAAIAQFGPDGLTGRVTAGPYRELADALIRGPTGRHTATRIGQDGTFSAGAKDLLPTGQYLANVVLTDRQQRRMEVYNRLLSRSAPEGADSRSMLFVWARPPGLPFTFEPGARKVDATLLAIPLEFVRTPPDTRVIVPGAFIPCLRVFGDLSGKPITESGSAADMRLRFQVPESLLPFSVKRARLVIKITAPGRHFRIGAYEGDKQVELYAADGPVDVIAVDITREAQLRLDERGALYVNVAVSELPAQQQGNGAGGPESRWSIDTIDLEVEGRTLPVE